MPFVHQPPTSNQTEPTPRRTSMLGRACPWVLTILAASLLYGLRLGSLDLWAPDEPRYAAIAEELRSFRHGLDGLVLLHLNDTPYTQKPPLYFWLAALFGTPFGRVTELAARLPSALAGVAAVTTTAWIGQMLLARRSSALLAAGLLATSFRFGFTARRAQLDVLLTLFELVAIALFVLIETRRGGAEMARRSPLLIAGLHTALGAAALTKGPVGWLPLAVFAAYLAWEGRGNAFRAISPWWCWMLSIGPLAAWTAGAIVLAPPGFAEVAIGENVLGRFFAGTSHARPFYYYLYQLPLDFLPWSLLLPLGLVIAWRSARGDSDRVAGEGSGTRSAARFLLVWASIPFLFFSLSAGKRGLYLLPIFPALALMIALAVRSSAPSAPSPPGHPSPPGPSWRGTRRLATAIAAIAMVELLGMHVALPRLETEKSPRPIAIAAAARTTQNERVGVFAMTPIEGALLYYGGRGIASLRDRSDLEAFVDGGGRVVLMRERDFLSLGPELGLLSLEGFRSGRRRLMLVAPAGQKSPRDERAPL